MIDQFGNKDNMEIAEGSMQLTYFVKNLADEYADKYNEISLLLNELRLTLLHKETVLENIKLSAVNNNDLFSPNVSNKTHDVLVLKTEINEMKLKQDQYLKELELNKNRNLQLLKILQSMHYYDDKREVNENCSENDIDKSNIDKGLELLEIQEKERQRIARDLHDSTVQSLTSLVHKTELCKRLIDIDAIRAKLELAAMSNTIKSLINELRYIIYNLKPMSLDDLGLNMTVERYAMQLMETNDIPIVIKKNDEPDGILSVVKLTLFRVIQEACSNIIKHANAKNIEIVINYQKNHVMVSIFDDGSGFNSKNNKIVNNNRESGFGLSIMKERVSLLSGTIDIQSKEEKGTKIIVSVPITKFEGEKHE